MRTPALLALCLVLAACSAERSYHVGVVGRGTVLQGADLAARQIDGSKGINGVPLRALLADTGAVDAADSARLVAKLAGDTTVKFILQQAGEGMSEAVRQVYDRNGVPVLVMGPELVRTADPWIFHLMPSAAEEAQLMASQAEHYWQPRRVAIMRAEDAYGGILARQLRAALPPADTVVLDSTTVTTGDTTVVAALERTISATRPDVLFWLAPPRVLGIMMVRLRQHLPELRIMGSSAVEGKRIYERQDTTSIYAGLLFVRAAAPSVDTARYNQFRYQFSIWMGGQATSDALLAYDATTMLADAMRQGALSRTQLRDYLVSLGRTRPAYQGITGPIAFDSLGVLRRELGLAEVRNDGVAPVPIER